MATMVLVHGGWSGGFCWDALVPELEARGHRAVPIEQMPSAGPDPASLGGLQDDVAHLRTVLDEVGDDVVLVSHSSGGLAAAEVADHPSILRSVYVAAFLVPRGMSLSGVLAGAPPLDWQVPRDDGQVVVTDDLDVAHQSLAHDVSREEFATYLPRYVLQSMTALAAPVSAPPHPRPPLYVVCDEDRCVPAHAQEQMAGLVGASVEHVASSHCPRLSMPAALAELLQRAV